MIGPLTHRDRDYDSALRAKMSNKVVSPTRLSAVLNDIVFAETSHLVG